VERLVLAYLDLRNDPAETFLQTYRRLGLAPFKAALYPQVAGKESRANAA
jgi:sulfite reductase (NADPH) hemoprotein beta-component